MIGSSAAGGLRSRQEQGRAAHFNSISMWPISSQLGIFPRENATKLTRAPPLRGARLYPTTPPFPSRLIAQRTRAHFYPQHRLRAIWVCISSSSSSGPGSCGALFNPRGEHHTKKASLHKHAIIGITTPACSFKRIARAVGRSLQRRGAAGIRLLSAKEPLGGG